MQLSRNPLQAKIRSTSLPVATGRSALDARRLAVLVTLAGKMKWTGNMQQYKCDYGAGGAYYHVRHSQANLE